MPALGLGLGNIPIGNLAQISLEHVTLVKDLPGFNKGDLQRRGGENGESQFRKKTTRTCSWNMTCCQIL